VTASLGKLSWNRHQWKPVANSGAGLGAELIAAALFLRFPGASAPVDRTSGRIRRRHRSVPARGRQDLDPTFARYPVSRRTPAERLLSTATDRSSRRAAIAWAYGWRAEPGSRHLHSSPIASSPIAEVTASAAPLKAWSAGARPPRQRGFQRGTQPINAIIEKLQRLAHGFPNSPAADCASPAQRKPCLDSEEPNKGVTDANSSRYS
jgi:hypothetical protein